MKWQRDTVAVDVRKLGYERTVGDKLDFSLFVEEISLRAGQKLAIVGPSGCGKSTLLDLIALLRQPSRCDSLRLGKVEVMELWLRADFEACSAVRAQDIGVVLQTGGLLPYLTLQQNLMLPLRLLGLEDARRVQTLIRDLDLAGLEQRLPAELSVGQRQRAAVGRALVHGPSLVLADEPTASLGTQHADAVMRILTDLCVEIGSALLIASHDMDLLERHEVPMRFFEAIGQQQVLAPVHAHA
jgi:putative ABC transport system ATP-binding protein